MKFGPEKEGKTFVSEGIKDWINYKEEKVLFSYENDGYCGKHFCNPKLEIEITCIDNVQARRKVSLENVSP